MKNNCFILMVLLSIVACNKSRNGVGQINYSDSYIEIIDSLKIDEDSVLIYIYSLDQYSKGLFLGFDPNQKKLRLFDNKGRFLNYIGENGEGPGRYMDIGSFYHYSPDSIFVADFMTLKLLLYNKTGNFVSSWDINKYDTLNSFPDYYNNGNLCLFENKNNDLVVEYSGFSGKANRITVPKYYEEARLISSAILSDGTVVENFIPYPPESPYRKGEYMLSFFNPMVKRLSNGHYIALFGHDDNMYLYNDNKEHIKTINSNSSYFPTPKGVSFDVLDANFLVDQVKYNYKHNAINYLNLIESNHGSGGGKIYKQYFAPMGDNPNIPDDLNAIYSNYYKRDTYLQVFDKNLQKIDGDILQPEILKTLLFVDESDNLIFSANNKLTEENVLYIARIRQ